MSPKLQMKDIIAQLQTFCENFFFNVRLYPINMLKNLNDNLIIELHFPTVVPEIVFSPHQLHSVLSVTGTKQPPKVTAFNFPCVSKHIWPLGWHVLILNCPTFATVHFSGNDLQLKEIVIE